VNIDALALDGVGGRHVDRTRFGDNRCAVADGIFPLSQPRSENHASQAEPAVQVRP
jgi:hypothetical protein